MTPTNTLKRISRDIEPLAAWLKIHKPACGTISLTRSDYNFLRANHQHAVRYGFAFSPTSIHYSGFEVRPGPNPGAEP